jgi:hypothetical protein
MQLLAFETIYNQRQKTFEAQPCKQKVFTF